jgi:phosphotransferase system HPr (HPr) family protein
MIERILTVKGQLGLHARAAARLVRIASGFQSRLSIERLDGSATADAKSILSVLMLAASRGTKLRVIADGHDETEAMAALDGLFANAFGEIEQQVKVDD